jgi:ACS family hexuronate transporter-like MFS transporter
MVKSAWVKSLSHLRWWIAGLLAAATALNYLDRQALPVLIGEIQKEVPLTDAQFGRLQSLFLLAYGLMYAVGGRLLDKLGTRLGYALMIAWWSIANVCQGLVHSVFGLGVFRFLLGMGEGGGFPASAKAVAEWFPVRERSLAFGLFNTGSSVGAVIAPPLIAFIVLHSNWRWVFFITGAGGLIWAVIWWFSYRPAATHPWLGGTERDHILGTAPKVTDAQVEAPLRTETAPAPVAERAPAIQLPWLSLLRRRPVLGLVAAKFLSDSAWFFLIFWLPKYLNDVRQLNIKQIGAYAWIPYALAGAGSLLGGWLSSFLLRRGLSLNASRKIALGLSASLMPVSLGIVSAPLSLAIVFFSLAMFAHQFWSTIMQTLAADLFPARMVGSVAGLMGAAGSFGAMFFSYVAGYLIQDYGYSRVFFVIAIVHPLSFVIILFAIKKIEPSAYE